MLSAGSCGACICTLRTFFFFFFNDTATTEIYTLSLHDALPICGAGQVGDGGVALQVDEGGAAGGRGEVGDPPERHRRGDRERTRLNSPHPNISYAVFCLKKKKKIEKKDE